MLTLVWPTSTQRLVSLDSLFSDPPAVRWRREAQYLKETQFQGLKPWKRDITKSPYFITNKRSSRIKAMPARRVCDAKPRPVIETPMPTSSLSETKNVERRLRRKKRELARRERLVVCREVKARDQEDRAAAAQAAANAAVALSRRLAMKLAKRCAPHSAGRVWPSAQQRIQVMRSVEAPVPAAQKKAITSARVVEVVTAFSKEAPCPQHLPKKFALHRWWKPRRQSHTLWAGPTQRFVEDSAHCDEAVLNTQSLGGDLVELEDGDVLRVLWRSLSKDEAHLRGVRLLSFDCQMRLIEERLTGSALTADECLASSQDVFVTALVLDCSRAEENSFVAAGFVVGTSCGSGGSRAVLFSSVNGTRLRIVDLLSTRRVDENERGNIFKSSRACFFAEQVFPAGWCLIAAVFRRRGSVRSPALLKAIATTLPEGAPCQLVEACSSALARARVQPYSCVDIEHCSGCEGHETTTKHVPGSYEDKAYRVRNRVLGTVSYAITAEWSRPARIGAFEVRCQEYAEDKPTLLYSKFGTETFPDEDEIATTIIAERMVRAADAEKTITNSRTCAVKIVDSLGYAAAAGTLIYLLKPVPCSFCYNYSECAVSSSKKKRAIGLGQAASALRCWNRADIASWLVEVAGLSDNEARLVIATKSLRSGPDLLLMDDPPMSLNHHRRKALVEAIKKNLPNLPDPPEMNRTELPSLDRAWAVESVTRCDRRGRCALSATANACAAAHFGDPYYLPWSTLLTDRDHITLELRPREIQLRVNINPEPEQMRIELVSTRRLGRLRLWVSGPAVLAVPADVYVLTAGWRLLNLNVASSTISVMYGVATSALEFRQSMAATRLQLLWRRRVNKTVGCLKSRIIQATLVAKRLDLAAHLAASILESVRRTETVLDFVDEFVQEINPREDDDSASSYLSQPEVRRPRNVSLPLEASVSLPAPSFSSVADVVVFEGDAAADPRQLNICSFPCVN